MSWDEHYRLWSGARQVRRGAEAHEQLQAARKRVAHNSPDDWQWLRSALDDPQKKWFVAEVFRFQPVPKRLLVGMLRTAVYERDPSLNRYFVEPCLRSFGARRVNQELLRYLEVGTDKEKAGVASAFYWSFGLNGHQGIRHEDLSDLWQRVSCLHLREFVNNQDLDVRRRIMPLLVLREDCYPEELQPLVLRAVEIARAHPDDYIRHRVEIQLGAGGPYMPLPNTSSG